MCPKRAVLIPLLALFTLLLCPPKVFADGRKNPWAQLSPVDLPGIRSLAPVGWKETRLAARPFFGYLTWKAPGGRKGRVTLQWVYSVLPMPIETRRNVARSNRLFIGKSSYPVKIAREGFCTIGNSRRSRFTLCDPRSGEIVGHSYQWYHKATKRFFDLTIVGWNGEGQNALKAAPTIIGATTCNSIGIDVSSFEGARCRLITKLPFKRIPVTCCSNKYLDGEGRSAIVEGWSPMPAAPLTEKKVRAQALRKAKRYGLNPASVEIERLRAEAHTVFTALVPDPAKKQVLRLAFWQCDETRKEYRLDTLVAQSKVGGATDPWMTLPFTPKPARTSRLMGHSPAPPIPKKSAAPKKMKPPFEVPSGAVLRPTYRIEGRELTTGTLFLASLEGRKKPLAITALHVFGPSGGLARQLPNEALTRSVTGLSLEDLVSGRRFEVPSLRHVELPTATTRPAAINSVGDIAAFQLGGFRCAHPFPLRRTLPNMGETVWLIAQVGKNRARAYEAKVYRVDPHEVIYDYVDNGLDLRATSGAPVVDKDGKVVAVNKSVYTMGKSQLGGGTLIAPAIPSLFRASAPTPKPPPALAGAPKEPPGRLNRRLRLFETYECLARRHEDPRVLKAYRILRTAAPELLCNGRLQKICYFAFLPAKRSDPSILRAKIVRARKLLARADKLYLLRSRRTRKAFLFFARKGKMLRKIRLALRRRRYEA